MLPKFEDRSDWQRGWLDAADAARDIHFMARVKMKDTHVRQLAACGCEPQWIERVADLVTDSVRVAMDDGAANARVMYVKFGATVLRMWLTDPDGGWTAETVARHFRSMPSK